MASSNNEIKGGYWLAEQANILPPQLIRPSYFTHLFYGFAAIDATSFTLDISRTDELWIPIFIEKIQTGNPQAKAFLSIGGPKSSGIIADLAMDIHRRANFISSTIEVAHQYGFDGLDLAWEYPRTSEDVANLGHLLKEWRQQITQTNANLFLTARVYFSPIIRRGTQSINYPCDALEENLDFLNVIAYDYSPSTSVRGQLHVNPESKRTDCGIFRWLETHVSANKLVLGIPLYGNKWTLADRDDNGIEAPVISYDGVVAFRDIPGGIRGKYDPTIVSEYKSDGTFWYGYCGPRSIREKIKYARSKDKSCGNKSLRNKSLGGYFLYSLGDDDDQYTLSQAAYNA